MLDRQPHRPQRHLGHLHRADARRPRRLLHPQPAEHRGAPRRRPRRPTRSGGCDRRAGPAHLAGAVPRRAGGEGAPGRGAGRSRASASRRFSGTWLRRNGSTTGEAWRCSTSPSTPTRRSWRRSPTGHGRARRCSRCMERLTGQLTDGAVPRNAGAAGKGPDRRCWRASAWHQPPRAAPFEGEGRAKRPATRQILPQLSTPTRPLGAVRAHLAGMLERKFGARQRSGRAGAFRRQHGGDTRAAARAADTVIVFVGPNWRSSGSAREARCPASRGRRVVPIFLSGAAPMHLLPPLARLPARTRDRRGDNVVERFGQLIDSLANSSPVTPASPAAGPVDVDDPQRGQWGGRSELATAG